MMFQLFLFVYFYNIISKLSATGLSKMRCAQVTAKEVTRCRPFNDTHRMIRLQ